jgi:uncharacterized protein (TIGR02599 family)
MKTKLPISDKTGAFTLIEVMVSMVIVLILVLVFSTMTDRTAKIWRDTRGKVSQFQQARDAFDLITRNLSQATLNTYFDYYDAKGARREAGNVATFEPSRYGRYSDLRFVTGKASQILGLPEKQCPSQALFFYAPLGETGVTANTSLNHLLNLVGYYISYDADTERPNFMPIAQGYGFRLMELRQRSESLTMPKPGLVWPPAVTNHPDAHIVARNIVALTFLPKLAEKLRAKVFECEMNGELPTVLDPSNMQNIDAVFQNTKPTENLPGLLFEGVTKLPSSVNAFRTKYNKGSFVWDIRFAYSLTKQSKLSFIIKNALNTIYSERPALIAPPRNFTLQLAVDL